VNSTDPRVTPEALGAYFDDESTPEERAAVASALERDPELRAQLADLEVLRQGTVASLEAAAEGVPQARFEQIWDEIDRAIDREHRLRDAAERHAPFWARVGQVLRPVRWPMATLGIAGAAAVTALWVHPRSGPENNPSEVASVAPVSPAPRSENPTPPSVPAGPEAKAGTPAAELALAPASDADPGQLLGESDDAQIETIEFGGRVGRVEQVEGRRGTTTVIWVSDEEPAESERSL
jgi:anti-sigma factor RsiW